MAQVIVRNLDDAVKRKLQRRAARHGRSMEEEIRDILRDAVKDEGRASRWSWHGDREAVQRHWARGANSGIARLSSQTR